MERVDGIRIRCLKNYYLSGRSDVMCGRGRSWSWSYDELVIVHRPNKEIVRPCYRMGGIDVGTV